MAGVNIKTPAEIELMKAGGHKLATVLQKIVALVRPGITTKELDTAAENLIKAAGGEPAFKGYRGYPATLCTSINDELVHGIPSERALAAGDIISLDLGLRYQGFCADMAVTVAVGKISKEAERLLQATREALNAGLAQLKPGCKLGDVGAAVQAVIEGYGFGVVRDLVGHGIGREVHEEPQVPNFGKPGTGLTLQEGMVICLEPMLCRGSHKVKTLADGWTVVSGDGGLTAHFEHTIAITSSDFVILTK